MSIEATLPALVRGAEEVYTVSVAIDGVPVSLVGHTLVSELWWDGEAQLTFTVDDGLEILDLAPEAPADGEDPAPQYQVRVDEETSADLPVNRRIAFWHTRVSPDGKTIIRGPFFLPVKR